MNENNLEFNSSSDLGYGDLLVKLWQRRFWFAGVFTSVLAIGIPLSLAKTPVYQSYMQILAESNYQSKEVNSRNNRYIEQEFTDANIEIDYATQIKVLKSSEILKRVVEKLDIADSETSVAEAIEILRSGISVYQIADEQSASSKTGTSTTKIIQTSYAGSSPTETKEVLEAVREIYLNYNLEQQEKRLRDAITFIEKRIPQARAELVKTENALTGLTKKNNLISPEAEATSIKENIRQINRERKDLEAQERQIAGNYNKMQEQLGISNANSLALSRLSQSPRYQKILNDLQATEREIATKQINMTENNPSLKNALEERKSLKNLLYQEAEKVLGKLPPNFNNDLESLQKQGQLVASDLQIVDALKDAQVKLAGIRQRSSSLAETEVELKQKLVEFPELISQYKSLSQESQVKREALQRLLEAKQELEIELSRGGHNWQVIEPPQYGLQTGPNTKKDLLLSVVVATFLGAVAAFTKDMTDDRINTSKEIKSQTNYPILGTIPGLSTSSSNSALSRLPFASHADEVTPIKKVIESLSFREAVDLIYENLKLSYFNLPSISSTLKLMAVTSAISGEGKSTFTLGLASSIARQKQKVLVVDADLRSPSIHEAFALNNCSGLTNFLAGEIERPLIQRVSLFSENIDVITAGSKTEDPVKLLNSSKFERFIERQKQVYDLILVDTPPVIGVVDAIKIASMCDTSVLVTRLNKSKISQFLETTALLSKLDVLGIIINNSQDISIRVREESKFARLLPQKV